MDRITIKQDNGFYKLKEADSVYGWENGIRLVQIVGKLEDLFEKYGVESIEELEKLINKER